MKTKNALFITAISCLTLLVSGCKTRMIDPNTGEAVQKYDPVKTEQVKAAVEPVAAGALRRAIQAYPQNADEIAKYARAVGAVFCQMDTDKAFSPESLLAGLSAIDTPLNKLADGYVIDVKNAIVAVYRIYYAERFRAALPADQWPAVVSGIFCASIDQGLRDAGRPGIK